MADRWTHDRGRSDESRRQRFEPDQGRDRWGATGGYDYGAGGARGQEERSFRGSDNDRDDDGYRSYSGQGGGERGYGDDRVFGERETGASYGRGQGGYGGQGRYGGQGGRSQSGPGRGYEGSQFGEEPRMGGDYGRRGGRSAYGGQYASQGGGDLSGGYRDDRYRGGGRDWSSGDAGYSRYAGGHQGRDRDDDRGFFERAGDQIARWFDDDDDRRPRGRHHGRGPSGYKRSDARISEDIHDRLTDDDELDASNIQVQVQDGEVTLSGTVADREDKHRAERLAERVGGVDHVQNNLRIDRNLGQTGSHLFGGAFARDEAAERAARQDGITTAPEQVKSVSDGKN